MERMYKSYSVDVNTGEITVEEFNDQEWEDVLKKMNESEDNHE